MILKNLTIIVLFLLTTSSAQAFESYSIDAGRGDMTYFYKIAARQTWENEAELLQEHGFISYWELSLANIDEKKYDNVEGKQRSLIDFGLTPVLRWDGGNRQGLFAEMGIGINYFTQMYDNNGRILGCAFQFSDHIGAGYVFANHVEVTLKFEHMSDAGIKKPNSGLNMSVIKFSYPF